MKNPTPGLAGSWSMPLGSHKPPAAVVPPPAALAAIEQLAAVPAQALLEALHLLETATTPRLCAYAHGLCQGHRSAAYARGELTGEENLALDTYMGQLLAATSARVDGV